MKKNSNWRNCCIIFAFTCFIEHLEKRFSFFICLFLLSLHYPHRTKNLCYERHTLFLISFLLCSKIFKWIVFILFYMIQQWFVKQISFSIEFLDLLSCLFEYINCWHQFLYCLLEFLNLIFLLVYGFLHSLLFLKWFLQCSF